MAATQSAAFDFIGPIAITIGLVLLLSAITDPAKHITRFYESNKGSRMGFMAISPGPKTFRFWVGFSGCFTTGIGIAMVVIAPY